jgi:hypothetical protein
MASLGSFTFQDRELLRAPCSERYDVQDTKEALAEAEVEHNGRFPRTWSLSGYLYDTAAKTYLERMAELYAVARAYAAVGFTDDTRIPDTDNTVSVYITSIEFKDPFTTTDNKGAIPFSITLKEVT